MLPSPIPGDTSRVQVHTLAFIDDSATRVADGNYSIFDRPAGASAALKEEMAKIECLLNDKMKNMRQ